MKSVITCAIALTALIAFASPAKAQGATHIPQRVPISPRLWIRVEPTTVMAFKRLASAD
jgi:hypothetical protein